MDNQINRLPDESIKEYKLRLFRNKEILNIKSSEIAELINKETENNYNESTYRKWFSAYEEGYKDKEKEVIDNSSEDEILKEYELKRIEFEKEKVKFYDQRNAYSKVIRDSARWDEVKEIVEKTIKTIQPYKTNSIPEVINSDNDLLIGLNDIHFGIEIDNYWNKYNPEIAKEKLEKYLGHIYNIQKTHDSESCYVCANGDLISGNIHMTLALANRENIIQQVMGVSELISWFLQELSSKFKNVYFSCVAGNHSRLTIKENAPKNERLDDLIPFYVKARLQNQKNVVILDNKIDNTLSLVNIRGLNYAMVHGDMDTTSSILKLIEMIPEKIYAIVFGHLHHNATNFTQGYKTLMSGSLLGMDDYCIEKRIKGEAQQLVSICDTNGVRCHYDIILN